MKKPQRLIFWLLGGGVILIAVFVLAVNLYVQSEGMRRKIQHQLSTATGLEARVFRAGYTPWGGFRLHRIEYWKPGVTTGEPVLTAESLQIYSSWYSLLTGHVVLNRVVLDRPILTLRPGETGGLLGPQPIEAMIVPGAPTPAPTPAKVAGAPPTATPSPATSPKPTKTPGSITPLGKPTTLRKIALREGTVRILDNQGVETLRVENIRFSADSEKTPGVFVGKLNIAHAIIRGTIEITDFYSPVSYQDGKVDVEKIQANCAKGRIGGQLVLQSQRPGSPYDLSLKLSKLQLPGLLSPDSDLATQLSGQLSGELHLTGQARVSRSTNGAGNFKIIGGQFQQYPMLQVLGEILRSDELNHVELRQAITQLEVHNSDVQLKTFELASQNLRLTAQGEISSSRELSLNCLLFVNESTFKRLPTETRANFQMLPNTTDRSLSFKVDGTTEQPRTDFLKRLAGDRLERKMRGFFDSFSGKKADSETPDSTPSPTP